MNDFSLPNVTNVYGVEPSQANFIEPGKRPMSSMTPSIIKDSNGDIKLLVGAAGGSKIITSVAIVSVTRNYYSFILILSLFFLSFFQLIINLPGF